MATEERVLCFERKLLEESGVFQGLSLEVEKYLRVVTSIESWSRFCLEHLDVVLAKAAATGVTIPERVVD